MPAGEKHATPARPPRTNTRYFARADVHLPDALFDGTVGNGLFLGHVITFDFCTNRFWIG